MRQGGWGFRDAQRDARRRRNRSLLRGLLLIGMIAAIGWYSFMQGRDRAEARIDELETQVAELDHTTLEAREESAAARAEIAALRSEAATWRQRYESEVPQGDSAVLWQLLIRRLDEGVSPDRLAEVVELAANKRNCDAEMTTKRIIVKTHLHGGTDTAASFADTRITVVGEGESARDDNNNPVAWFDPAKTVKISFVEIGGATEVIEGYLPLNHTMLLGSDEWRFSVTEGPRNFALISAERCDYP